MDEASRTDLLAGICTGDASAVHDIEHGALRPVADLVGRASSEGMRTSPARAWLRLHRRLMALPAAGAAS
jgi:hypothetical protein